MFLPANNLDITHQKINNFVSGTLKSSAFLLPIQKLSLYLQCTTFETGDGCSPTLAGLAFFMAFWQYI